MERKIVEFPKEKSAKAPKTDAELLADIKKAQRQLIRALDKAVEAGLTVDCRVDASDQYGGFGAAARRVRYTEPTATRVIR